MLLRTFLYLAINIFFFILHVLQLYSDKSWNNFTIIYSEYTFHLKIHWTSFFKSHSFHSGTMYPFPGLRTLLRHKRLSCPLFVYLHCIHALGTTLLSMCQVWAYTMY